MRKQDRVVAIALSDIHLSLSPPIARAQEPDWLEAQARPWKEVRALLEEYGDPPILCAGDIFDRWNASAELINWALDTLPTLNAIPGNHDLPSHREEGEGRSAYGTLVRAGKIMPVEKGVLGIGGLSILLVHEYLWITGSGHPGALPEQRLTDAHKKRWRGADVVVVGDNHKGFLREWECEKPKMSLINCGTLMRRKSDEARYSPMVGLIHQDGSITPHYLDTSEDIITELVPESGHMMIGRDAGVADFVEELMAIEGDADLDFRAAVIAAMERAKTSPQAREILTEAINAKD